MNKLANKVAKHSSLSPAAAADEIDKVVHSVIRKLRRGESATLPGVGTLQPGADAQIVIDKERNAKGKSAPTRR
jgi:nucleoid DNA-binding protein